MTVKTEAITGMSMPVRTMTMSSSTSVKPPSDLRDSASTYFSLFTTSRVRTNPFGSVMVNVTFWVYSGLV